MERRVERHVPAWAAATMELLASELAETPPSVPRIAELRELAPAILGRQAAAQIDSVYYLACAPGDPRQAFYDRVWEVQRSTAAEALACLERDGVAAIVFKGAHLFATRVDGPALGLLNDVDLLVDRRDLPRTKRTLFELGFRQGSYSPADRSLLDYDTIDVARKESTHVELAPFAKLVRMTLPPELLRFARAWNEHPVWLEGDEVVVQVDVDVHHGVASNAREAAPFFAGASVGPLGLGLAMHPSRHLCVLAGRYYNELADGATRSLRTLAYLIRLRRNRELCWDTVLATARALDQRSSLYYPLSWLEMLHAGTVPSEVLGALHPARDRDRDRGPLIDVLLDLAVPAFSELAAMRPAAESRASA